jgi:tripartite-type tricarboxylate transporter receptor subunit TctC
MWFAPGVGADRVARSVAERLARAHRVPILGLAPAE